MHFLDLTQPTPQENLALEEALVEDADSRDEVPETLRIWESQTVCVVMGRSSKAELEVCLNATQADRVPVLRRSSGGSTVVIGPGCLLYSVVLSYEKRPQLRDLDKAHAFVVERVGQAVAPFASKVQRLGTSDLTELDRKFSGNAMRCKRRCMLYHGTLLYDFPLELVSRYLLEPPRQPDYRQKRTHDRFVTNLKVAATALRQSLIDAWTAYEVPLLPSENLVQLLLQQRYLNPTWHGVPTAKSDLIQEESDELGLPSHASLG